MKRPQLGDDEIVALLSIDLEGSPYRPLGVVGRGGMGAVVEVADRATDARFVLKVLHTDDRPDLEDRLRYEAQVLARLDHPNLLRVHEFARAPSGRPYLRTEKLVGATLADILVREQRTSLAFGIEVVAQALAGLGRAHDERIVHRDIKPANLFVSGPPDRLLVKVIDFGIAKFRSDGTVVMEDGPGVRPLEKPTAANATIGTPLFMAPEQFRGDAVDRRSDLYAMGGVLYRTITGQLPFEGSRDFAEMAMKHLLETPIAPSRLVAAPPELDAVLLRALAKKPEDRFQDAREMADALRAVPLPVTSPSVVAAPKTARERSPQLYPARLDAPDTTGTRIVPIDDFAPGKKPRS